MMRLARLSRTATLLALFLALPVAAQRAPATSKGTIIDLNAQASRDVANDLARATVYIEMTEMTEGYVAEVAERVNKRTAEVLALARQYPSVRVQTAGSTSWPVYDKTDAKIEGWRMRADLSLESRDLPALSALIGRIQSLAALGQLGVGVAPETWRRAEDETIVAAIRAFEARAKIAADALGRRYRIVQLSVQSGTGMPQPMYRAARGAVAMDAAPVAPPIEAGESQVNITVSGSIELLD